MTILNSVKVGTVSSITVSIDTGMPLTIFSVDSNVCQAYTDSITGETIITTYEPGSCIIVAIQEGDTTTLPIQQVISDFEVTKIPQVIVLYSPGSISLIGNSSTDFSIKTKITDTERIPVLVSDTPLVCSINTGTLSGTAIAPGICRITATSAEDIFHSLADPVSVEFQIMGTEVVETLPVVTVPQSQIVSGTVTKQYSV